MCASGPMLRDQCPPQCNAARVLPKTNVYCMTACSTQCLTQTPTVSQPWDLFYEVTFEQFEQFAVRQPRLACPHSHIQSCENFLLSPCFNSL